MSSIFVVVLLVSLALLVWGFISPRGLAKTAHIKKAVTRKHTGLLFGALALVSFVIIGVTAPSQSPQLASQQIDLTTSETQPQVQADSVTTKTVTETQPIAFTTKTENDSTLPKGQTKTVQAGVDGVETLTYKVTYTNGEQTNKELISTTVTTPAVDEIVKVGTYVAPAAPTPTCTNGTYVNSVGNTVCSPETAPSAPAGATAQCVDGTYSFSQTHSGTCSHHGGVAAWL